MGWCLTTRAKARPAASPPSDLGLPHTPSASSAVHHARRSDRADTRDAAVLLEQPAGGGAGRDRLQGVLLSLPGHADGAPRRGDPSCRRLTRPSCSAGVLAAAIYFDGDDEGRARDSGARRRALPARRLAVGAERWAHGFARMEAGERFLKYRWEGYSEALLLYVLGLGLADAPAARGELRGVDEDLPLEEALRHRVPLCRARSSSISSRTSGSTFAASRTSSCAAGDRLLREQPPRDLRAAAVRDPQPASVQGLQRELLGDHRERRPWSGDAPQIDGVCAASTTTRRAASPSGRTTARSPRGRPSPRCRSRRRSCCRRFGYIRRDVSGDDERIRLQVQLQPDLHGRPGTSAGWISQRLLRARPGADGPDDRELPFRACSGA